MNTMARPIPTILTSSSMGESTKSRETNSSEPTRKLARRRCSVPIAIPNGLTYNIIGCVVCTKQSINV